jgi:hypothetical protein
MTDMKLVATNSKGQFLRSTMSNLSRIEASKEVRRVLTRQYADLSYCQYSIAGLEVRLTGWPYKFDNSDYNNLQVERMIQEFQQLLPGLSVTGDFDNWNFSIEHITFLGDRKIADNEEDSVILVENSPTDFDSEAS